MRNDKIYGAGMDTYPQDDKGLLWWDKPRIMEIVARDGDILFVPKENTTSSIDAGGFYIPVHPLCFDIVQQTIDCLTFVSYDKDKVKKFIKLAKEIESKYLNISTEQRLYYFKSGGLETSNYDLFTLFDQLESEHAIILYNLLRK